MKWFCMCAVMAAIAWVAVGCGGAGTAVSYEDTAAARAGGDSAPDSAIQQQDRDRLQDGSCDGAACQDRDQDRDRLRDGSCGARGIQIQDRDRDECGDCEGPCTKARLGIGA